MFEQLKLKVKSLLGGEGVFSTLSPLPFYKNKKNYGGEDYLNAYEICLYLNRAIEKRAEKVAQTQFQVMVNGKAVDNHEVLNLLYNPNKLMSGVQFWKVAQKHKDIFGCYYIFLEKEGAMGNRTRVNAMHLLRPDMVKPYFNKITGELSYVEHKTTEGTQEIDGENIIYDYNPSPRDVKTPEPLIRSGMSQVSTSVQIEDYQSRVLENGGRVDGVFNFKAEKISRQQMEELKDKYQEEYGNAAKAGMPLFLSGNADYKQLGLTPAEIGYLETKKTSLNDIAILTGVPKALLGSASDEKYANADAAIRIFLQETILPLVYGLVNTLSEKLIPQKEIELSYVDPTPENREEIRKDIESGIKNYFLTPNEAREMMGIEPIQGGDKLYAPLNIMPISEDRKETAEKVKKKVVGKSPACRMSDETKKECVDRKIPELIEEGYSQEQAVAVANSMCSEECKTQKINHPLRDVAIRRKYHQLQLKRLDRRQSKMKNIINDYFDDQKERLIEELREKKHFRKKDLLGEIFNKTLEIKLAKETVLPVLEEMLKEAAEDSKEVAGSDWDFEMNSDIEGWLDKRGDVFAKQINDTTFKKLKSEFAESISEGEDRRQLINRIENTYEDISKARAATIARTEIHGATQKGTMEGYRQGNMPIKIWVWAPGTQGGVRDKHKLLDGKEEPLETEFSNGLMFPGEPGAPAEEVINCQCFI